MVGTLTDCHHALKYCLCGCVHSYLKLYTKRGLDNYQTHLSVLMLHPLISWKWQLFLEVSLNEKSVIIYYPHYKGFSVKNYSNFSLFLKQSLHMSSKHLEYNKQIIFTLCLHLKFWQTVKSKATLPKEILLSEFQARSEHRQSSVPLIPEAKHKSPPNKEEFAKKASDFCLWVIFKTLFLGIIVSRVARKSFARLRG